jgi:hypothetical protein
MYKLVKYQTYGLIYTENNLERVTTLYMTDRKVAERTALEYSQLEGVTGVKILERTTSEKIIKIK